MIHQFSLLPVLLTMLAANANAQVSGNSTQEIIGYLSRSLSPVEEIGMGSGCQDRSDDRAAAVALAKQGDAATKDVGRAIDILEMSPDGVAFNEHSVWLLYAYAKMKRGDARPKIRGPIATRGSLPSSATLDRLIALSLSLTSYISESHSPPALRMADGRSFFCRPQEPRDALDQFLFAWITNNVDLLEASLGRRADETLKAIRNHGEWMKFRNELSPHGLGGAAIGYSFKIAGRWSLPEEALEATADSNIANLEGDAFSLDTDFTDRNGKECGRYTVRFLNTATRGTGLLDIESTRSTSQVCFV